MGKLSFGATGLSYQVDRPAMNVGGGAPMCPRCTKRVYFNEEKKHLGKSFHKACFNCVNCRKHLDSTNVNGHEDEVYCTACHRRKFGIKGYGFAGGAAGLSTEMSTRDMYRPRSSRLSSSGSTTTTTTVKIPRATKATEPAKTNGHATREEGQNLSEIGSRPNSTVFKAPLVDREHPDCCPRCGKRVYMAEEVKAIKRKWHRLCFKCASCNKTLEAGRCEGHQGEVYCNPCYAKSFGPKGYGYASSMVAADPNPHFHVRKAVTARASSVSSSNASSPGIAPGRMSPALAVSPGIAARMSPAPAMSPMQTSPAPGSPAAPISPASQPAPRREYQTHMTHENVAPADKLHMRPTNDFTAGLTHSAQNPNPYGDVRQVPKEAVSDTFTYNGEEWTDEKIMNELNQFQQVMM